MTEQVTRLRRPIDVARLAGNVPFVLRTVFGLAVLGIGINIVGVLIVAALSLATRVTATDHQLHVILVAASVATLVCLVLGVSATVAIQRRTLRWLLRGETPDAEEARRALQMPFDMAVITAILWTLGGAVMAVVIAAIGVDARQTVGIVGGVLLAGYTAAGLTYLLTGRVNQQVARLALAAAPPRTAPVFDLRWRLLTNWVLTSGLPLIGLVLVLSGPPEHHNVVGVGIVVALLALMVGVLSTVLVARAIGLPLRAMVATLRRVGDGELEVTVPLDDAGEIGLLQNGINEMVAGLRERDHVKDLFGRHVGPSVAQEAIRSGVTLSGELTDVVALFVDITGSTRMSREEDPKEFVAKLNRFFAVVVEEVEANGGLLNKFEGDAALCVFGTPVAIDDPAGSALRAARAIRDRIAAMGEVQVGIGVAAGPAVAGQIGTHSRLEYTVIGDAVNEAARLTSLAKKTETRVLASGEAVRRAAPAEAARWTQRGEEILRGRGVPTEVWTA